MLISLEPRRAWRAAVILVSLAPLAGCGLLSPGDCTTELRFGLVISLVDKVTNRSPTIGSRITVTGGQYIERFPESGAVGSTFESYGFALERPGRYSVSIETAGYQRWSKGGIEVSVGHCGHVGAKRITATLVPGAS